MRKPKRKKVELTREEVEKIIEEVKTGSSLRAAIQIVTGRFSEGYFKIIKDQYPEAYELIRDIRFKTRLARRSYK